MFSYFQNQQFPTICNQTWFYNQPAYQYTYSFYSPGIFEWNYLIEQNQNNWPFTTNENKSASINLTKPLINYKNFDFKQQTRKINDGSGFSLISNLNSSNSLISYDDEKIRTIYDVFRKAYKLSGILMI